MEKRQVLINANVSVLQTVATGIILFILYRFLLKTIGVEQLGIWSLVMSITGIAQVTNFGFSGSVVKFIAKYVAHDEKEIASKLIQTAAISIGILMALVLLAGYPIAKWMLELVTPVQYLQSAFNILPLTFVAFWLLIVTSIFQSGLDGVQRIDLRGYVLIGGSIINLIFCYTLAPSRGLMGVAYARVIENTAIFFGSWFLLRKHFFLLPIIPYKWEKSLFKELFGYGITFQVMSGVTMFYDPFTKAFLSKFGGLQMVGYYEMASKMIWQLRGLIVSGTYVILPVIADLKERMPEKIHSLYLTSYHLIFYIALLLYSFIIVCSPIISELWIGHFERVFVVFATLLAVGWFINTLNTPAYFANLGVGELRWNMVSHITIGLLNIVFGFMLGLRYGGNGVVVGWIISLAIGTSLIGMSYHIKNGLSLTELLPGASKEIIAACSIGVVMVSIIYYKLNLNINAILLGGITILLFLTIIMAPFWGHPMRKRLAGWVTNELSKRKWEANK